MFDFTTVQFKDHLADEFYSYWLNKISFLFRLAEEYTVLSGKRALYITVVGISELNEFLADKRGQGLYTLVLGLTSNRAGYLNTAGHGTDLARVLVSTKPLPAELNSYQIGKLLGYPDEDIEWFVDIYEKRGILDPTVYQYSNELKEHITVKYSPASVLYRWFGVRLVPHIPKDPYACRNVKIADMFAQAMHELGFVQELMMAQQIMQAKTTYSTLNKIGVVENRQFRLIFLSIGYPNGMKITIEQDGEELPDIDENLWLMNGFTSYAGMLELHYTILRLLKDLGVHSVCDLGCGNGLLLSQFSGSKVGYEIDNNKIKYLKSVLGFNDIEFINDDVLNFKPHDVDAYIISIYRLVENQTLADKIRQLLGKYKLVLVDYNGDTIAEYLSNSELGQFVTKRAAGKHSPVKIAILGGE